MRMGDKVWSGAAGTIARDLPAEVGTKGLTIIRPFEDGFIPRDAALWADRAVGAGLGSNVIMSPIMWVMRTFTEAQARVQRRTSGVWEWVEDHEVEVLIDRPNEFYDGDALWKGTCVSFLLDGNAYWRKIRNRFGGVVELWYTPHWLITPKWPQDGSQFISHYEYRPGGTVPQIILPRDIIHFRFGLDPENPRLGLSPIRALLQEIFTDDEAARFSATILKKMGIPGLMVAPKNDGWRPTDDDVKQLESYMATAFTGGNRGKPMIMKVPTDVSQFGFDPNKLMLGNLRDIAEERVCAAIGLPAAVVGFGSGLQSTKVGATMRELVRLAWVQCLIPMQRSLARQLTAQLLPDFVAQTRRFQVRFDESDVSVFAEEADLRAARVARLVQSGILRVDRAQALLGLEVDDTQQIYLRPSNSMPIDEQGNPITGAAPAGAVAAGGDADDDDDDDDEIPAAVADRMNGRRGRGGPDPDEEE